MSDNQPKNIVPKKSSDKNSSLARRGLEIAQKEIISVSEQLKEISEFFSPITLPDGGSKGGNFETGHIATLFSGGINNQGQNCLTYINSNASVIFLTSNDQTDAFVYKMVWDKVQKAYKQHSMARELVACQPSIDG
jgi:hypothetical protein